jgi:hypothetical protein
MVHLGLGVLNISWLPFVRAQLPALWLTIVVGSVTLATAATTRHLGLPPLASLVAGLLAAVGTAAAAASLAPMVTLGEHGIRMRDTLRAYWLARLHPPHVGEST